MIVERDEDGAVIAYETTQCLTGGIRKVLLREDNPKVGQTVSWETRGSSIRDGRIGGTVHLSYSEACTWAKLFRDKRIEKLREQITKLENLTFGDEKMTKPLEIDECVQRYIAALDEIQYIAEQLAARMGIATEYQSAKDYLEGLHSRMEDLTQDIENIMLDTCND